MLADLIEFVCAVCGEIRFVLTSKEHVVFFCVDLNTLCDSKMIAKKIQF